MTTYNIENLTSMQANTIIRALDLYSRLSLGQVGEIGGILMDLHFERCHTRITRWGLQEKVNEVLKPHLGLEQGSYLGMGHKEQHEAGKIAYDVECVLRNHVAKAEQHNEHSVWHRTPLHYSQEPLPTVTINNDYSIAETPKQSTNDQDRK